LNEQTYKAKFQKEAISLLLDKYESSKAFLSGEPSLRRPQFSIDGTNPFSKDYSDEMDPNKRMWIHEVLEDLEKKLIVELIWQKHQKGQALAKVFLCSNSFQNAYKLADRTPKHTQIQQLIKIFQPLVTHPWSPIQKWAKETLMQLKQNKTSSLNIKNITIYQDVISVLNYLPTITDNQLKRTLSQQLFLDSKHFETSVEQPLLSILRKAYRDQFEDKDDILPYFGIVKNPRFVHLKGPIEWTIDNKSCGASPFIGGIGISAISVKEMEIQKIEADQIILIENLTSYEQWISQRLHNKELVIYLGGFPHRTLQTFLKKISEFLSEGKSPPITILHWGDIDVGGIRIFHFIQSRFFSKLRPLFMDIPTLLNYQSSAMVFAENYKKNILDLQINPRFLEWVSILDCMLEMGVILEQECIADVRKHGTGVKELN